MALQIVSAMQPFAQAGLVNLPKLAEYVLSQGFGVKDPSSFLQQAPPPEPPMPEGMPPGMEGMPPEMGGAPMPPEMPVELPPGLVPGGPIQGVGGQPGEGALPGSIQSLPPEIIQALLGGQ
jgi:hypothetical protein